MKYEINSQDRSLEIEFLIENEEMIFKTGGKELVFQAIQVQPGVYSVLMNNRPLSWGYALRKTIA